MRCLFGHGCGMMLLLVSLEKGQFKPELGDLVTPKRQASKRYSRGILKTNILNMPSKPVYGLLLKED
jgi:hypothetical protein